MAVAVVGLVLLVGCSRPVDRPAPLPTPTAPAVSGTPSPSPQLPTPGPTVTEYSPAGATAFVEYYFAVLNYAYTTGDTSTLESLSAPSCKTCHNYVQAIKQNWARGRTSGGQVLLSAAQTAAFGPSSPVITSASYRVTASQVVDTSGQTVKTTPPDPGGRLFVELVRSPPGWSVASIKLGSSS